MIVLPSVIDLILPSGKFRGEIWMLENGKKVRLAYVYGDTLEAMRDIKWTVYATLKAKLEDKP